MGATAERTDPGRERPVVRAGDPPVCVDELALPHQMRQQVAFGAGTGTSPTRASAQGSVPVVPEPGVPAPPSGVVNRASAWQRNGAWLLDPWRALNLILVTLVLALLVFSGFLTREVRRARTQMGDDRNAALAAEQRTNKSLNEQMGALAEANNGLSRRIANLENRPDPTKVIAEAKPSVFTVTAGVSSGSAFVFQVDGNRSGLVTNFHVIEPVVKAGGDSRVTIENDRFRRLSAVVVKSVPESDLALLIVEAKLPTLTKAARDPLVGDPVIMLGSPVGLGGSASTGIVSARRGDRWQFTAPASPGNSGGPLLNQEGHVIGVTTSKVGGQNVEGISFAVAVQTVCRTVLSC